MRACVCERDGGVGYTPPPRAKRRTARDGGDLSSACARVARADIMTNAQADSQASRVDTEGKWEGDRSSTRDGVVFSTCNT